MRVRREVFSVAVWAALGSAVTHTAFAGEVSAAPAAIPAPATVAAATPASVAVTAAQASFDKDFPRPSVLQPNVAFWNKVFTEYSEYQSVIQSMDDAWRVYRVLDFRDDAIRLGPAEARRRQNKAEKAAKREINERLKRVHALRNVPEQMNAAERELYHLFDDSTDPGRFKDAVGRLRAQRGLKERTEHALAVSSQYLPEMESIFKSEGLPPILTRLPLVESSFNVDAYSKVGAAGLWQFIPSSARLYMRLDEAVDERRDPWTSTRGAARHLKEDFELLGSWPLAVTAYNYGRDGLAKGLRQVKGNSLEDLLNRWDGRRFGFASRNFYAEFLAAVDVERAHRPDAAAPAQYAPLAFETVETRDFVAYETLRRCATADADTFRRLNPGFRPEVLDGRLHVPPHTAIRVPVGHAQPFETAYASLGPTERFNEQRFYYVRYRVQRGDTLGRIAKRYGIYTASLKDANGISNVHALRVGQTLRIPPRHGSQFVKVAVSAPETPHPPEALGMTYLLHKVQVGETLPAIAQQYKTTVAVLRELNHLDERQLNAGAMLRVPSY